MAKSMARRQDLSLANYDPDYPDRLADLIREHVLAVLNRYRLRCQAAKALGISERTLLEWVKVWKADGLIPRKKASGPRASVPCR